MPAKQTPEKLAKIEVCNIGGIDETTVSVSPGVSILTGRNATNRTSFLQAIAAAMGSDNASLKGDAEDGYVKLDLDDEVYTRKYSRSNDTVTKSGDPYLEDPGVADTFAFLFTDNEARRAVTQQQDLHELIMEPVDTAAIETEIRELKAKKDEIDNELDEIDEYRRELPELEQERKRLESNIEEKHALLEEKENEIEETEANVESKRTEKEKLETHLANLREKRAEKEKVRSDIDVQRESIRSLQSERRELKAEASELPGSPVGGNEELQREIESLHERKDRLEDDTSTLQDLIEFNEEMLDDAAGEDSSVLRGDESDDAIADRLVEDKVRCWTCGSEVGRIQIEGTIEHLKENRSENLDTIRSIEDELEELTEKQHENEKRQRRRETIDRRLEEIVDEINRRETSIESLQEDRTQLSEEIESLEAEVEALEAEDFDEILDLHREANQLEFELERLESEREDVVERIDEIENRFSKESQLRERYDAVTEQLTELRTRIDQIEEDAVEAFNKHMTKVLEILEYDNLERIWIERQQTRMRDGRQTVDKTLFDIHIVRTTEAGTTYEDSIDHLSESEREVTGLIFALAGYLVHDLHETVPFLLLDSLEAIDADRIANLVPYMAEFSEYTVVALLPEDTQAFDDTHTRVAEF
ncbi:archaea-specific SMC-related protein [Natrinema halophilum]|uniref:archaea-specific SMC-related protein n=1 Tax=Natrinema halophilum TaxID=1699371 RepID=UPI001F2C684B|nr:archaea-specific SMC-related protein [Natrinema halophilum]UHQ96224.1 chromosome segregation protein SMC [Natrinema halophilum]